MRLLRLPFRHFGMCAEYTIVVAVAQLSHRVARGPGRTNGDETGGGKLPCAASCTRQREGASTVSKQYTPVPEDATAATMDVNQMGYVRPLDVKMTRFDAGLRAFIKPDARVYKTHADLHQVKVTRDERGYTLDITAVNYVWHPEDDRIDEANDLEVVAITDTTGDVKDRPPRQVRRPHERGTVVCVVGWADAPESRYTPAGIRDIIGAESTGGAGA